MCYCIYVRILTVSVNNKPLRNLVPNLPKCGWWRQQLGTKKKKQLSSSLKFKITDLKRGIGIFSQRRENSSVDERWPVTVRRGIAGNMNDILSFTIFVWFNFFWVFVKSIITGSYYRFKFKNIWSLSLTHIRYFASNVNLAHLECQRENEN